MALNPQLSTSAANEAADAVCALLDGGYLRIYDGVQPASADTAVTSQTLLAELEFGSPAFNAAANGVATATTITDGIAEETGTATWLRAVQANGTTAVFDGSVGTTGANLNLTDTAITSAATVSVSGFTYTQQKD
jgi:hypothetical protein